MQIIQRIEDLLFDLFPNAKKDINLLKEEIVKYYTYGPYKPKVSIENDFVIIDIDTPSIISQQDDYNKAIAFCEKGKYAEAKKILRGLIEKNPSVSEYYRNYGQVLSEEGDQNEAINYLIDALKWDPKNTWALIMMGNIFARYKNDADTAMKYYDQALKINPNDSIAANNIGGSLLQQGKIKEAQKYLWHAYQINPDYPNTHYALGLIAEMEGDLQSAFFSTIEAIKKNHVKDVLFKNSVSQAFASAQEISKSNIGRNIVEEYLQSLETRGGGKNRGCCR